MDQKISWFKCLAAILKYIPQKYIYNLRSYTYVHNYCTYTYQNKEYHNFFTRPKVPPPYDQNIPTGSKRFL